MSDLTISLNAQLASGVTFVRGRLLDPSNNEVGYYDAPTLNGHMAEDFTFREPGAGSYRIEFDLWGPNNNQIAANAFSAGPFHHETSSDLIVGSITAA